MKLLIIPSNHFRSKEKPDGSVFQYDQAMALKSRGIEIAVFSVELISRLTKTNYIKEDMDNLTVYRCRTSRFLWGKWTMKNWVKHGLEMYKMLTGDGFRPDIIHAHNIMFAGVLADAIRSKDNIPFLVTEHSSVYLKKIDKAWQKPFTNKVLKNAKNFICVSKQLQSVIQNTYCLDLKKALIMPNTLGAEFNHVILPERENRDFTFLHIASLIPVKAQHILLRAFKQAFAADEKVKLVIGGDGRLKDDLRGLCEKLQLDSQVRFSGSLTREEVREAMLGASAFVLSSIHETFGVVLIEALSCGLPLVATRCGGPQEIIDDSNGILVEKDNIDALAAGMKKMYLEFRRYKPEALRAECLNKYGAAAISKKLIDIYSSCRK